jgi:hypothetical protein
MAKSPLRWLLAIISGRIGLLLIFISWSGAASEAVATSLANWLPLAIQVLSPWVSTQDIQKGQRWAEEIAEKLEEAQFGILCLTPENLEAPWLLFEAGAIAKLRRQSRVCTYLLNVRPSDLAWPLAMFQAAEANKRSTLEMLLSINGALGPAAIPEARLRLTFNLLWPQLEERLAVISAMPIEAPTRSSADMLAEILAIVRQLNTKEGGGIE